MATEAPVNIAPLDHNRAVGPAADTFLWQPRPVTMHVIRPKSAKGRTRPSLHAAQGAAASSSHTPPAPPQPAPCEPPTSRKPGACTPRSPAHGAPNEIPELLQQQVPFGASSASSLNKYPVLPSINRRSLEERVGETQGASSLQLKPRKEDASAGACPPEEKVTIRTKQQGFFRAGNLEEPSDQEPRLLLAVRSPSGQRFVRHFRPTDALHTVVAVAEQKNQTTYPCCSIETMEVPRRRFSDLTRSLQECQIPHKSVLSISQEDREGWP
ncbi:UBX domain-containing protein 10 [Tenrec ecaudatus]|uniref:UBX domain-containing protein 10 n=1 Tax=Tenrec ecaudatus TaxID=94439 RepID=UPI003F5A74B0